MNKDNVFKLVQKYLECVPLILIGTGATIPLGIPGMSELAQYLLKQLNGKYSDNDEWNKLVEGLNKGIDLETAITDLHLNKEILEDIKICTWKLISKFDLILFENVLTKRFDLPFARLLKKFSIPHPQCINIITTNYDRMIEYASDLANLKNNTKFSGTYIKYFSSEKLEKRNIINILKVHGSLDLFKDKNELIYSVPLQSKIPDGFYPEIITPGLGKYRSVLQGVSRQFLHEADDLIDSASCYLCIGYGFNDEQIQTNIIRKIKAGIPIVVVTKSLSENALNLICNNSTSFMIIQESKTNPGYTKFISNKDITIIEGDYWSINEFIEII